MFSSQIPALRMYTQSQYQQFKQLTWRLCERMCTYARGFSSSLNLKSTAPRSYMYIWIHIRTIEIQGWKEDSLIPTWDQKLLPTILWYNLRSKTVANMSTEGGRWPVSSSSAWWIVHTSSLSPWWWLEHSVETLVKVSNFKLVTENILSIYAESHWKIQGW